jgi:hypothetical protein
MNFRGTEKKALICLLPAILFGGVAAMSTEFYFLGWMPRSPQPLTGRIYPAGAAFNTLVYVNRTELGWFNFLKYDVTTVVGVGVILFVIFILLPAEQRAGLL